jgi:hypothetical protein
LSHQSGPELVAAMPREAFIQRRAKDRVPEGVPFVALLEEAHPQSAIQRVEQHRNAHGRVQCRRPGAELAQ